MKLYWHKSRYSTASLLLFKNNNYYTLLYPISLLYFILHLLLLFSVIIINKVQAYVILVWKIKNNSMQYSQCM